MKWWEVIFCIVCITFCYYSYIKAYSNIFRQKVHKLKNAYVLIFLILLIVMYYNTFYNYSFSKIVISFLDLLIVFKYVFTSNIKTVFIKSAIIYLLGWIIELVVGLVIAYFTLNSVQQFDYNIITKVLFSTLVMLIFILISNIKVIKKISNNIHDYMCKAVNITITIVLFIIVLVMLTYYLIISNNIISYVSIIALIIILTFLFVMLIIQSVNVKKSNEKQEILLNFMKEYEAIIDKERIDRHEMTNNLLVLKSIKDKNSDEYEQVLNEMLNIYKSVNTCTKLYDLPSGLKGVIYYKIYDMKSKNINVTINISNHVIKELEKLNAKFVSKLCKILGILLDNAKEAAEDSKEKIVIIDMYEQRKKTIIYIENTFNDKRNIRLSEIKTKGFSTKGQKRGYGLYLIDIILKESNAIELYQNITQNKFISKIIIK